MTLEVNARGGRLRRDEALRRSTHPIGGVRRPNGYVGSGRALDPVPTTRKGSDHDARTFILCGGDADGGARPGRLRRGLLERGGLGGCGAGGDDRGARDHRDDAAPAASEGDEVSEAGETLALGTRVVAPYVVYGKSGASQNTKLGVTVLRIRKGKISDFKDFNLDAKQKKTTPYFVDVKYENLGTLKLQRFLDGSRRSRTRTARSTSR